MGFVAALGSVFYFFAIIGMEIHAGRLFDGCCQETPVAAYYSSARPCAGPASLYWMNNFNNIVNAYITLFELLIVNNWFVVMDGHVAVTNRADRAFFIFFYLIAVVVVINVVVAFLLDTFMLRIQGSSATLSADGGNNDLRGTNNGVYQGVLRVPRAGPRLTHAVTRQTLMKSESGCTCHCTTTNAT